MRTRALGISVVLTTMLIAGCGGPAASSRSSSSAAGSRTQWPSRALNAISAADCISAIRTLNSLGAAYRNAAGQSQLAAVASTGSDASSALGFMINTSPGLDEIISLDIQQAASDADLLSIWIGDDLAGLPGSAPHVNEVARALGHDTAVVYGRCGQPGLASPYPAVTAQSAGPTPAPTTQLYSPPPERPGYASALSVWEQTRSVWPAHCSSFLLRAADDLRATGESRYAAAIGRLTNLASIPLRGVTPAQSNQGYADVEALNRFFGTPGLITC